MSNIKLWDSRITFQKANNLPTNYKYKGDVLGHFISFVYGEFMGFQLTKSSVKMQGWERKDFGKQACGQ